MGRRIILILAVLLLTGRTVWPAEMEKELSSALDRGLKSDETYAYVLREKALKADSPEREELYNKALRLSPDMPVLYFELSKNSLPNLFKSLDYMVQGVKAYGRSFWWKQSIGGTVFIGVFLSLAICLFIVASLRLPMELPLAANDLSDSKKGMILFAAMVFMSALGALFFACWALLIAGLYQRKIDKAVVYISLLLVILSPLALGRMNLYLSSATPELRAIVAVNEGRDNKYAIRALEGKKGFEAAFSYALALKREGRYEEAVKIYKGLLSEKAYRRVYNNLGNAYVALGRIADAKAAYKQAHDIKPSAENSYNLSQLYRDGLDFKTGDEYFSEAQKLSRDRISYFTTISSSNPNRYVIDETLTEKDFINYAKENRKTLANPFTVHPYAASFFGIVLFVLFLVISGKSKDRAYRCSKCSAVVGGRRKEQLGKMCPDCFKSLVKMEDLDSRERVAKLLAANERENRRRRLLTALSFAPPGVIHVVTGRLLAGLIYLWLFITPLVLIVLNRTFSTGIAGYAHWWLAPVMICFMLFVYLFAVVIENRRLQWL